MTVDPTPPPNASRGARPAPDSDPPLGSSAYSFDLVTNQEELFGLEEEWNRLSEAEEDPNVFNTFDWFRTWNERFALEDLNSRRRLQVFVSRRGGVVTGVSPLIRRDVRRSCLVLRKIEFLEAGADYNDLLLGGGEVAPHVEAIVDFLADTADEWDIVDLSYLRKTRNDLTLMASALARACLPYRIMPQARCPYVQITGPSSEIVRRLSKSSRRTIRNQQYRLERMQPDGLLVRIVEHPQDESDLIEKLASLQGQKRFHGKLAPPFLSDYRETFQSLFEALGRRRWIFVALMELGDRPLAFQLGFRCGKKLWNYITAHDQAFSRLSPGTMLVPAVLDYGFTRGYEEYDFLSGEAPYKMRWSSGSHQTYRLLIWNRRWLSWAYLLKTAADGLFGHSDKKAGATLAGESLVSGHRDL